VDGHALKLRYGMVVICENLVTTCNLIIIHVGNNYIIYNYK